MSANGDPPDAARRSDACVRVQRRRRKGRGERIRCRRIESDAAEAAEVVAVSTICDEEITSSTERKCCFLILRSQPGRVHDIWQCAADEIVTVVTHDGRLSARVVGCVQVALRIKNQSVRCRIIWSAVGAASGVPRIIAKSAAGRLTTAYRSRSHTEFPGCIVTQPAIQVVVRTAVQAAARTPAAV